MTELDYRPDAYLSPNVSLVELKPDFILLIAHLTFLQACLIAIAHNQFCFRYSG
jgi:hypothetical protein